MSCKLQVTLAKSLSTLISRKDPEAIFSLLLLLAGWGITPCHESKLLPFGFPPCFPLALLMLLRFTSWCACRICNGKGEPSHRHSYPLLSCVPGGGWSPRNPVPWGHLWGCNLGSSTGLPAFSCLKVTSKKLKPSHWTSWAWSASSQPHCGFLGRCCQRYCCTGR